MRSLFFICLYAASFAAVAAGADTRKPLELTTVVAQQKQIRDDLMIRKGRYKDMPDPTRVELLSRQAELLTMLDGKRTAADLTEEQQMQAFNTLEWIEAAINNAEDERVICRREKSPGQHPYHPGLSHRRIRAARPRGKPRQNRKVPVRPLEPQPVRAWHPAKLQRAAASRPAPSALATAGGDSRALRS